MGNLNFHQIIKLVLIMGSLCPIIVDTISISCSDFSSHVADIKNMIASQQPYKLFLERIGYVSPDNIFGAGPSFEYCTDINLKNARLHTLAAQYFTTEFNMSSDEFISVAQYCKTFESPPCKYLTNTKTSRPKYRSIDGRGNNLQNPEWGASNTPFLRLGSKNYEDKVYSIKKSVTGLDLPNARTIVQDVLWKVVTNTPPPFSFSVFLTLTILFVTHDVHYQVPTQPENASNEIRCCSRNGKDILPPNLLNTACLPIEISKNDSFYKDGNIGCLNMVRSQVAEFTNEVQPGEILNLATSFMDLSLIYGNHDSELALVRSYKNGTFRMGKNNVLPVDSSGQYIGPMKRFTNIPVGSIYPALVARNHNQMAQRLANLNPHWTDEIIFQEARRINIAIFDSNFVGKHLIEGIINVPGFLIDEIYTGVNPGTFIEFAIAYRALHYFLHDYMLFLNENNNATKYLLSDTVGKIGLLENSFDDAVRGVIVDNANLGPFSFDLTNRIGKNSKGYGVDVVATDIQRARDHGCPSYLEIRSFCSEIMRNITNVETVTPEINSFDDYNKIFNKTNVDLLRNTYASYKDVDFYVGGLLETFETLGTALLGPTFSCIVLLGHQNFVQGDAYYYTSPENPYPFTQSQINSIDNFTLTNLICTNSGVKKASSFWPLPLTPTNPFEDCSNFPEMNLNPWKERKQHN